MEPFVRSGYNYDMDAASVESGLECKDPSLAKQSFVEDADINTIVERFKISGELPTNVRMPTYDDFTEVGDFKSAMDAMVQAKEAFEQMPAVVRKRFNNDPQEFVVFCSNEENIDEARKLGLVPAAEVVKASELVGVHVMRRDPDGRFRLDTAAEKAADAAKAQ